MTTALLSSGMSRRLSLLILALIGTIGLFVIRLTMAATPDLFAGWPVVQSVDRRLQADQIVTRSTGFRQMTSPALGIQAVYPETWSVVPVGHGQTVRYFTNEDISDPADLSPQGILVAIEADQAPADSALTLANAQRSDPNLVVSLANPISIDSSPAVQQTETFSANDRQVFSIVVYSVQDGRSLTIRLSARSTAVLGENRPAFDSFLSSIEFLPRR